MKVLSVFCLILVAVLASRVEAATTYKQCTPPYTGCYEYTGGCFGTGTTSGTVYFEKDFTFTSSPCCRCNSNSLYSCYACSSSLDCSYSRNSCDGTTTLATGIIIAIVVIPVVIIVIVTIIVICCCCCAAAAAASQTSHNTVSGTTVIVQQQEPVMVETYEQHPPAYVQNTETVEMQQMNNPYGQPVYVQTTQPGQQQYAPTYSY